MKAEDHSSLRPAAVVTGASSGIGRALAFELGIRGYDLYLVARRQHKLDKICKDLADVQVSASAFALDLTAEGSISELAAHLAQRRIIPDVLVNNAGVGCYGAFCETGWNAELNIIALNILALTKLTKYVVPPMRLRGSGRILNVASTAAFRPGPYYAVYAATKAYVLSFSEALHSELAGTGVTVTTLCPGPTYSEFDSVARIPKASPLKRLRTMSAENVARYGVNAMLDSRALAIPGLSNQALMIAAKMLPFGLVRRGTRACAIEPHQ